MTEEMTLGDVLRVLQDGTVEIEGLLPWSSNYAFLVRACVDTLAIGAVYKPERGERPLWDFPQGTLCLREMAAFVVSEALGWGIVPPTALRDAQHGLGTIQLYIDHNPSRHYFTIEGDAAFGPQLQKIALFDIAINNADRKAGHVLIEQIGGEDGDSSAGDGDDDVVTAGRLWGIDHGICFHTDPKLRTVIWEFAGAPIPAPLKADLEAFRARLDDDGDELSGVLSQLLSAAEIEALRRRVSRLISRPTFPQPGAGRHYPWPPV